MMINRTIKILGKDRKIQGDTDYLGKMGAEFEPDTVAILAALCDNGSYALDIGANIGLTALALSDICSQGKVIAIEPVPRTFELLKANLESASIQNVSIFNVAVGAVDGSVSMYVDENNLATSFVVEIDKGNNQEIPLTSLDSMVSRLEIPRLDFIKIDVEGCELEVLKGAVNTINLFKPIVLLEMNHWCLNVFRRISLPEFRDHLLNIFPFVYAVEQGKFLDFSDPINTGKIYESHVFGNKYMNIVAGFDKEVLLARLSTLVQREMFESTPTTAQIDYPVVSSAELELKAMLNSRSWKITAPLRQLHAWIKAMP